MIQGRDQNWTQFALFVKSYHVFHQIVITVNFGPYYCEFWRNVFEQVNFNCLDHKNTYIKLNLSSKKMTSKPQNDIEQDKKKKPPKQNLYQFIIE